MSGCSSLMSPSDRRSASRIGLLNGRWTSAPPLRSRQTTVPCRVSKWVMEPAPARLKSRSFAAILEGEHLTAEPEVIRREGEVTTGIGIAGVTGRMGRLLAEEVPAAGAALVGGVGRPGSSTTAPGGIKM